MGVRGVEEARPAPRLARSLPRARARSAAPGALLLVAGLTAVGIALRVATARRGLFGDELSTAWIVEDRGLGSVLSTVHSNAEITPPLYFILAWLTTKLGHSAEMVRLPSLVAGAVTIPAVYALGLRTVGRAAALVATAITALAPFMVYYSTEARSYAVMMALVVISTLALLTAVDTGRVRWWVLYAVASCGAAYSHYTCAFVLVTQLAWVLWAHPEARRAAILANVVAVVGFLPWLSGFHADLTSPTADILSALSPFGWHSLGTVFSHWTVGYPFKFLSLSEVPGWPALAALGVAVVLSVAGAARSRLGLRALPSIDRRLGLLVALAVITPLGEILVSAVSTHIFGVRNLAASWPALGLCLAALLVAAGPRLRVATVGLGVASFAVGAALMLPSDHQRLNYGAIAAYIDAHARPGDVVLDSTANLSPGPLSPMDVNLERPHPIVRADSHPERDHPFNVFDPVRSWRTGIRQAVARADGRAIYVVVCVRRAKQFPPSYRLVRQVFWASYLGPTQLCVYAPR